MDVQDPEPFARYLRQLIHDPLRIGILAAFDFKEETIEGVIAEAVPNSDCFNVPNVRFVDKLNVVKKLNAEFNQRVLGTIYALNNLRAAAAHRNYEQLRDERFAQLAKAADLENLLLINRESVLHSAVAFCFGYLTALRNAFQDRSNAP
jgi:hypothetical protein